MKLLIVSILAFILTGPIELESRKLLDNKIEILVPKHFKPMSKEMQNLKYNGQNPPTFVLTDENGEVNIAFNHLTNIKADQNALKSFKDYFKSAFEKSHPKADWKGDGIVTINNKKIGYLKLITEAVDQRVYNYLFITDIDGKLFLGTFNCTVELLPEWEATAEKIVQSFKVK